MLPGSLHEPLLDTGRGGWGAKIFRPQGLTGGGNGVGCGVGRGVGNAEGWLTLGTFPGGGVKTKPGRRITVSPSGTGICCPSVSVAIIDPTSASTVTVAVSGSAPVTVMIASPGRTGLMLARGVRTTKPDPAGWGPPLLESLLYPASNCLPWNSRQARHWRHKPPNPSAVVLRTMVPTVSVM